MEDGTQNRVLLLQEAIRGQVMQLLPGWLSPTLVQNRFCSPSCSMLTFSLGNKNISEAVKTARINVIHFFRFALTLSTATASFHLSSEAATISRLQTHP